MRAVKDSGLRPAVLFVLPVLTSMAIALTQSAVDPPEAHAQLPGGTGGTGGTGGNGGGGGTTLMMSDFDIKIFYLDENNEEVLLQGTERDRFFNRARCGCDTPLIFRIGVVQTSRQKVRSLTNADLTLRVGDSSCYCSSPESCRLPNCVDLSPRTAKLSELANGPVDFPATSRQLFFAPGAREAGCDRLSGKQGVYMVAKIDADEYSDLKDGIIEVQLDGEAPPRPANVRVKGGNEALQVSWDPIEKAAVDDMQGYVLFCSRDNKPVFAGDNGNPAFDPPYETVQTLCNKSETAQSPLLAAAAQAPDTGSPLGPDGTLAPPIAPFVERDKTFACTDLLTTQTSTRLFRLQNHITYLVGVASVDDRGNISAITEVTAQQPIPTVDFYRDYRAEGGLAEGGFCAVASRGRGAGWLGLAVLAAALALIVRSRRRS
jgi:hypothetical protein